MGLGDSLEIERVLAERVVADRWRPGGNGAMKTVLRRSAAIRGRLSVAICKSAAAIALTSLAVLVADEGALAAGAPSKVVVGAPCVDAKCHVEIGAFRYPHWEDIATGCGDCHEGRGDKHQFDIPDSLGLCSDCHEALVEKAQNSEVIHFPFEDGCLDCHNPHGSNIPRLVKQASVGEQCFECHESDIIEDEYEHGPAKKGACTMCHDPHASDHAALLLSDNQGELCGACHEEHAEEMWTAEFQHDLAECTDCHNPHSGPAPNMLRAPGRKLCGECHEDAVAEADNSAVDHGAVTTGKECVNCHSTHGANSEPMLLAPQRDLCLSCHDKRVKSGDGTLMNIKGWLAQNKVWHGPVEESGCTGCHVPHGGENFRLLTKPFPKKFYAPFDVDNYALCFSCHEKTVATSERTRSLTGFREGDRNLHFLHVNKEKKGRTCRACHEVHASQRERHIRDAVPFGKWLLPINFEKSENGGSCFPGCHDELFYDRNAPDWKPEPKE